MCSQVTIIVPVYNGGEPFQRCVESLRMLEYTEKSLQIIIINDGSEDNTSEWLNLVTLPNHFEIITHEKNKGRAAARNSGLKQAHGEYIIFLDADMRVNPDFVDRHLDVIKETGVEATAGLICSDPSVPLSRLQRYLYDFPGRGAKQFGSNTPISFQYLITGNMALNLYKGLYHRIIWVVLYFLLLN